MQAPVTTSTDFIGSKANFSTVPLKPNREMMDVMRTFIVHYDPNAVDLSDIDGLFDSNTQLFNLNDPRITMSNETPELSLLPFCQIRRIPSLTSDGILLGGEHYIAKSALKIIDQILKKFPSQNVGIAGISPVWSRKEFEDSHSSLDSLKQTLKSLYMIKKRQGSILSVVPKEIISDVVFKMLHEEEIAENHIVEV